MTHRHEYSPAEDYPLYPLLAHRRPRCSHSAFQPKGGRASVGDDTSRVVGDVLLKFAERNHFGPNFADFLEKAYQHRHEEEVGGGTAPPIPEGEKRLADEDGSSSGVGRSDALPFGGAPGKSEARERRIDEDESQPWVEGAANPTVGSRDEISVAGSPPSLADNASRWTANYNDGGTGEEEEDSLGWMARCSSRPQWRGRKGEEAASGEWPSAAVAARADHCRHGSADLVGEARERPDSGSPTSSSLSSVDRDHAVARGEEDSSGERPSVAVAARAGHCCHRSSDLADVAKERPDSGSPTSSSVSSVDHDHAVAILVSIFGLPWTAELLAVVLGHSGGDVNRSVDAVLAHGDGDPEELVERLVREDQKSGEVERAACKTERLGLEEENNGDGKAAAASHWDERRRLLQYTASHLAQINGKADDNKGDVPSEVLSGNQPDVDDVSLLSCPIAESSVAGSNRREIRRTSQPPLRAAPALSRHEDAIPREDSFARLLVSDAWCPKFRFSEVMPAAAEARREC